MRCLDGADADPLGVRTAAVMGILLIVPILTFGLSVRAGLYRRRSTTPASEAGSGDETWLIDAFARTLVLVLFSLLGLLALDLMYGNGVGAVNSGR